MPNVDLSQEETVIFKAIIVELNKIIRETILNITKNNSEIAPLFLSPVWVVGTDLSINSDPQLAQ